MVIKIIGTVLMAAHFGAELIRFDKCEDINKKIGGVIGTVIKYAVFILSVWISF